jgi:hypothetical protein
MGKHRKTPLNAPRHRAEKGTVPVSSSGMLRFEPTPPKYRRGMLPSEVTALTGELPWWLRPQGTDTGEVTA